VTAPFRQTSPLLDPGLRRGGCLMTRAHRHPTSHPMPSDRELLEQAWLHLTRITLPQAARVRPDWPVHLDHCFQRILLDNAVGGRWYDHVARRPAYRHAPEHTLTRAVTLGEAVLAGTADLHALNARSLAWRGKPVSRPKSLRTPPIVP
jgi:hypothetical protein